MENNSLNLMSLLKMIFNIEIVYHMKNKRKYFMKLLEKGLLQFIILKKELILII